MSYNKIINLRQASKEQKNNKLPIKRILAGCISAITIFSTIPNIKYKLARNEANYNNQIIEIMNSSDSREEQIEQIFNLAIEQNNNIKDEDKQKVIDSFMNEVVSRSSDHFNEEIIKNMYAVVKTEKISKMSPLTQQYGWWSGDYNSYTNTIKINESIDKCSPVLLAHEQLHAIMKHGIMDTGFTDKLFYGYGINEGVTALFGKRDMTYYEEANIANLLGMIIGYDTLFQCYASGDVWKLQNELSKYLENSEINELISTIDSHVYMTYINIFLEKNHIPYDQNNILEKEYQIHNKLIAILKDLFAQKYGEAIFTSNFGKALFTSEFFNNHNQNSKNCQHSFSYYNETNVKLTLSNNSNDGIANFLIECDVEQYPQNIKEIRNLIAKQIGVDGVSVQKLLYIDNMHFLITISHMYDLIDIEQIQEYNYSKFLDKINNINNNHMIVIKMAEKEAGKELKNVRK